jgi:5-bromo-4-chloroindolyl phosphate hydrolysis protein
VTVEVFEVIENEDGSADVQFTVSEEEKAVLIEEGFKYLMLKAAYELTDKKLYAFLENNYREKNTKQPSSETRGRLNGVDLPF